MRHKPTLKDYADQPHSFKTAQQEEDEFWDHVATIATIIIVVVALTVVAHCQQFPDAPSEKAAFILNAGLRITDATLTCIALGNGGVEHWLPTQNCAVAVPMILAGIPAQYYGEKIAKRYGRPWIARIIQWGFPIGSAYAIASSEYHWNDPKRRNPQIKTLSIHRGR